jgi:hypothetical protein
MAYQEKNIIPQLLVDFISMLKIIESFDIPEFCSCNQEWV